MNVFVVKNGIQLGGSAKGNASDVTLSAGPYNLDVASYDGVSFSVASQDAAPRDVEFSSDGTKMYVVGSNTQIIYQYGLSTPWDLSTASYGSLNFSVSGQASTPLNIKFKSDGTKMYVLDATGKNIYQYALGTAWSVNTASYESKVFSIAPEDTANSGFVFKPDGTKMFTVGSTNDRLYSYSLSSAWDISTASYDSVSVLISAQNSIPTDVEVSLDGTKLFVLDYVENGVFQYNLSSAWDLSTATYANTSFTLTDPTVEYGFSFKDDGTKMYVCDFGNDIIYQYSTGTSAALDLSTADAFEVTPTADVTLGLRYAPAAGNAKSFSVALTGADVGATYDIANASYDSVSFSVSAQDTTPESVFFKPDGLKMYVIGNGNNAIFQYSLSTAFDVSTASYDSVSFSVAGQDIEPKGLAFNADGTKMYVVATTSDSVFQYSLSTAFSISTASYDSVSFSVASQETFPTDVTFNTDGTKMYVVGSDSNSILQYSLSTAFDLSTASYDSVNFSVAGQEGNALGLAFSNDGFEVHIVGRSEDTVYQYNLSSAFDLSTASYNNISFSVAGQESYPTGVTFNVGGTKMYVVGAANRTVYQYTTGSLSQATITYPSSVVWSGGTAPTTPADGVTDLLTFYTEDGGNTYYGFKVGEAMA